MLKGYSLTSHPRGWNRLPVPTPRRFASFSTSLTFHHQAPAGVSCDGRRTSGTPDFVRELGACSTLSMILPHQDSLVLPRDRRSPEHKRVRQRSAPTASNPALRLPSHMTCGTSAESPARETRSLQFSPGRAPILTSDPCHPLLVARLFTASGEATLSRPRGPIPLPLFEWFARSLL
jgi:hypothetical protein